MEEKIGITVSKVIERYKIDFSHGPNDMYIEVFETPNGTFAECNYSLWIRKQESPYHHRHPDQDIQRAVSIVFNSVKPDSEMDLEDFCWVSETNRKMAVLGTGEIINTIDFKDKEWSQFQNHPIKG
jgi:hypothetical protein